MRLLYRICAFALVPAMPACVPAPMTISTSVTYIAPRPVSVDTVAILPVSAGEMPRHCWRDPEVSLQADFEDTRDRSGVRMVRSIPRGAVYAAGVYPGDVVVAIEDSSIASLEDLEWALRRFRPGERVVVRLRRQNSATISATVVTLSRGIPRTQSRGCPAGGLEGFRRMISDSLFGALTRSRRVPVLVRAESTVARLEAAGLTERYTQAVRDYQQRRVLSPSIVDSMRVAIGARYLLYTYAALQDTVILVGGAPVLGVLVRPGSAVIMFQGLQLVVQAWDGRSGDVVWGAVSNAGVTLDSRRTLDKERRFEEIVSAIVRDLVAKFMTAPVAAGR